MPDLAGKAYFDGTHRTRTPAMTWELIAPLLPEFGITRIADVSGLDVLGVPVAMAVRPMATTLSVSQGKGVTWTHAKVSAAMEAIELWHAESVVPPVLCRATAACELRLPYDPLWLDQSAGSLLTERTRLDWTLATGLVTHSEVPVPVKAVCLQATPSPDWQPLGVRSSSNGLASGNTLAEATVHALYEIVERDAVARRREATSRFVEPLSVEDDGCARLVSGILTGGAALEIEALESPTGVPCFACRIWSADFPVTAVGFGAHSSAAVALSRAITEAAQSRLTAITGTRDDIGQIYKSVRHGIVAEPVSSAHRVAWSELDYSGALSLRSVDDEVSWLGSTVASLTAAEPLMTELARRPEFAVVRVVAPGARFLGHDAPRPGQAE